MTQTQTTVCVVGAGAIGGFFGARLAQGFADVSVIARGATLTALQQRGWIRESAGNREVASVRAVPDAAELGIQDVVLLAVKAYAVRDVAPAIAPLIGPQTIVLPMLNGVPWWFTLGAHALPPAGPLASTDPDGVIARAIPIDTVVGAVVYPACSSPAPGITRHNSGSKVVFGEPGAAAGASPSPRLLRLTALFRGAGFDVEASTDIRTEVWKKLLGNACFNPVSLLTGAATDRLIDDPAIHRLFVAMMQETIAVGAAMRIDPGIRPLERIAVTRKLGNVKTSMLQDAEAGRPVELDAILAAVTELGNRLSVTVGTLDAVLAMARMRARTDGLMKE
ncbi:2-dehydropantoate 2-reductase [Comamonadaceae bacterium G21597-S1]|nr:2-dehydropantoate 2-reductase [Comamonadaceae bacterium G21597-S1]